MATNGPPSSPIPAQLPPLHESGPIVFPSDRFAELDFLESVLQPSRLRLKLQEIRTSLLQRNNAAAGYQGDADDAPTHSNQNFEELVDLVEPINIIAASLERIKKPDLNRISFIYVQLGDVTRWEARRTLILGLGFVFECVLRFGVPDRTSSSRTELFQRQPATFRNLASLVQTSPTTNRRFGEVWDAISTLYPRVLEILIELFERHVDELLEKDRQLEEQEEPKQPVRNSVTTEVIVEIRRESSGELGHGELLKLVKGEQLVRSPHIRLSDDASLIEEMRKVQQNMEEDESEIHETDEDYLDDLMKQSSDLLLSAQSALTSGSWDPCPPNITTSPKLGQNAKRAEPLEPSLVSFTDIAAQHMSMETTSVLLNQINVYVYGLPGSEATLEVDTAAFLLALAQQDVLDSNSVGVEDTNEERRTSAVLESDPGEQGLGGKEFSRAEDEVDNELERTCEGDFESEWDKETLIGSSPPQNLTQEVGDETLVEQASPLYKLKTEPLPEHIFPASSSRYSILWESGDLKEEERVPPEIEGSEFYSLPVRYWDYPSVDDDCDAEFDYDYS